MNSHWCKYKQYGIPKTVHRLEKHHHATVRQNHTQSHPTSENTFKKLCLSRRTFMILVICISTYISGFLYHESAIHATLPTVSLVCHLVPWHRSLARPTAGASAAPGACPAAVQVWPLGRRWPARGKRSREREAQRSAGRSTTFISQFASLKFNLYIYFNFTLLFIL